MAGFELLREPGGGWFEFGVTVFAAEIALRQFAQRQRGIGGHCGGVIAQEKQDRRVGGDAILALPVGGQRDSGVLQQRRLAAASQERGRADDRQCAPVFGAVFNGTHVIPQTARVLKRLLRQRVVEGAFKARGGDFEVYEDALQFDSVHADQTQAFDIEDFVIKRDLAAVAFGKAGRVFGGQSVEPTGGG